jgi:hypothetical protein
VKKPNFEAGTISVRFSPGRRAFDQRVQIILNVSIVCG